MAETQSKIAQIALRIHKHTTELDDYLTTHNLPSPSFAVGAAPDLPLPPHLHAVRSLLLQDTSELHDLLIGPLRYLTQLADQHNILISLQLIHKYDIASKIHLDEEVTYEEVAQRCNVNVHDLRRMLRLAIAFHIFDEPKDGTIRHSAVSECLIRFPLANQWIGYFCEDVWPSTSHTLDAIARWPNSEEPSETAFRLSNESHVGLFQYLQADADRSRRFTEAMRFLQSAPEFDHGHLLRDLQWNTEEAIPSLLVDIGGADGSIGATILRNYPSLAKCIVQDLPDTIASAVIPGDVGQRLQFQAHDIFTLQPIIGADAYFLRSTLHDFADSYAVQILRNLIPALKPGARVIVNEICVPGPNVLPSEQAQLLRGYDLVMKQSFNSKERSKEEWVELFRVADERFQLKSITCSPGSLLSVIEVHWVSDTSA
ncbi:putative O-methyltransferase [Ophiobolus disseminans]|uniref:Putative O-methyltransferase n=1 Tax=Ophiobolus disseminans TaxID=1469910 RepID=A0A6A7A5A4_9PLEO|nr:putative O-methyltransferase [Ophiobolus disseminans]